jgi:hypothetical protein
LAQVPPVEWVLAADLPNGARGKVKRWAREQQLTVHDIRQAGAYVRP